MKKILFLLALCTVFASCKTYHMQESQVFIPGKYIAKDTLQMKPAPEWKQTPKEVYLSIIKKAEGTVYQDKELCVTRKYFTNKAGKKLELLYFTPTKYKKKGIFFPGNGTKVYDYYVALKNLAIQAESQVIYVNYEGYGHSDGTPSFQATFADNNELIAYLRENDNAPTFVCGYSIGTIFATYAAADMQVPNLFLVSPLSSSLDYATFLKKSYTRGLKVIFRPFLRLKGTQNLMDISPKSKISHYTGTLHIYHSKKDQTVPYSMGVTMYKTALTRQKTLHTQNTGNHASYFDKENWEKVILKIKDL